MGKTAIIIANNNKAFVLVDGNVELEALRGHSLRELPVRYPDLAYGGQPTVNVLLYICQLFKNSV
jgi:hypothetical protein